MQNRLDGHTTSFIVFSGWRLARPKANTKSFWAEAHLRRLSAPLKGGPPRGLRAKLPWLTYDAINACVGAKRVDVFRRDILFPL